MDKKISELDVNPSITGAEEVPTERNSSNYKNTYDSLKTWVLDGFTSGIETVNGDGVNNTDPLNPVLSYPNGTEVLLVNEGIVTVTEAITDLQNTKADLALIQSNVIESNNITFTNVIGDYFGKKETPRTGSLFLDSTGAVTGASSIVYYNNFDLDLSEDVSFQSGTFVPNEINYLRFVRDADGFYSLTILNIKQLEFMLSLLKEDHDHIQLDLGVFDVNSLVGTGSYYFEIKFRLKELIATSPTTGSSSAGFGNVAVINTGANRFGIIFNDTGGVKLFSGGSNTTFVDYQTLFLNEMVTLRFDFTETGASTSIESFVNGEALIGSFIHANLASGNDSLAWINLYGTQPLTGGGDNEGSFDVAYMDLNGTKFCLNEGAGSVVVDTLGGEGNISTDNIGGADVLWNVLDNGEGNSVFNESNLINSVSYLDGTRSAFSEYSFITESSFVRVKPQNDIRSIFPNDSQITIFVDDVLYDTKLVTLSSTYYYIELPLGSKKVTVVEGLLALVTSPAIGCFITDIKIDTTVFTQLTEQPTSDKIVFIGDSVSVGSGSDKPASEAYTRLFNVENAHEVTVLGWSNGKVKDFASTPTLLADFRQNVIDSLSNVTANKKFVISLGTNDYGISSTLAATFALWYADLVDEIISIDNTIEIFCISPFFRTGETTLLQDYRDSISTICGTRSECTYIDGLPILVVGDLVDGLHPSTAGHKKYKDSIYGTITV